MVKIQRQSLDLDVYRGDTIVEDLTVLDEDDNEVDLTGMTGYAQIRAHIDGPLLLELVVTTVDAATGALRVQTATAAETESLDFGPDDVGVWDLELHSNDATPVIQTAFAGAISYVSDVTDE